jgi:predicted nucleic acid-binding protein
MPGDFVDSNVWLYAFIQGGDPGKSNRATQLVQSIQPIVSTQVINEVSVNLLRKAAFTELQVQQLIDSFYAKYRVLDVQKSTLLRASDLRSRFSLSFWDGLIVAAARESGCDVLYSEDLSNGLVIDGALTVTNPFVP